MTAILCSPVDRSFEYASDYSSFFSKREGDILKWNYEARELLFKGSIGRTCQKNLFFGFFFDGTKNNYQLAEATKEHSNVARLYDSFPGMSVPGVLPGSTDWAGAEANYPNFFKVYIPGVASPFKQVSDTGAGLEQTAGASAGRQGERRVIWALIQAINNVHRYFLKAPLISQAEVDNNLRTVFLNKYSRALLRNKIIFDRSPVSMLMNAPTDVLAGGAFESMLRALHSAISKHWPNPRTGRPEKIDPAIVRKIYISIFGFSRGAAEARAFANWLQSLCRLDAQLRGHDGQMSLGGFSVEFDFLGIFDTVASVGLANTIGLFDGHGAWADAEDSLRVPNGMKCLHLVAAHEPRRSFPVDSISIRGALPDGCQEIIVPGAHSDVGGGYCPGEQGRGIDPKGADMLARIPLIMMYKAARLNGVPLKLELASAATKEKFSLKPEVVAAFNAYIASCKETKGPIHRLMREHMRKQTEWRSLRRIDGKSPLQGCASFLRATAFHQNDLYNAGKEFEDEILEFEAWLKKRGQHFKPVVQQAGFGNSHEAEWEEIATWWHERTHPSIEVQCFFDDYVHDSRASFKLISPDNEKAMHELLQKWAAFRKQKLATLTGKSDYKSTRQMLSLEQQQALDEYEKTGKIPRMYLGGREPWKTSFGLHGRAGYLRFRKVYGGRDSELLS